MSHKPSQVSLAHEWLVRYLADGQPHEAEPLWNAAAEQPDFKPPALLRAAIRLRDAGVLEVTQRGAPRWTYRAYTTSQ